MLASIESNSPQKGIQIETIQMFWDIIKPFMADN